MNIKYVENLNSDNMQQTVNSMNIIEAAYFFMPAFRKNELDTFFNYICDQIGYAIHELEHVHIKNDAGLKILGFLQDYIYNHFEE